MRPFLTLTILLTTTLISAAAAGLQPGRWSGSITPPSGATNDVVYIVGESDGQTTISVELRGTTMAFRDVKVADDHVTFSWSPGGTPVDCRLDLQSDKSYQGTCKDPGGGTGHLVMTPPE